MNIEPVSLVFQLCAYLRMKFGNDEAGRIQIGRKKHLTEWQRFIYNIGRHGFRKKQTLQSSQHQPRHWWVYIFVRNKDCITICNFSNCCLFAQEFWQR